MRTMALLLLSLSAGYFFAQDLPASDGPTPAEVVAAETITRIAAHEVEFHRLGKYVCSPASLVLMPDLSHLSPDGELTVEGATYHLKFLCDMNSYEVWAKGRVGLRQLCAGSDSSGIRYSDGDVSECADGKLFITPNLCPAGSKNAWCLAAPSAETEKQWVEADRARPPKAMEDALNLPRARTALSTSGISPSRPDATGGMEILSDTQGVDFGPYLGRVRFMIERNWYLVMPEEAFPPLRKQGEVTIDCGIGRDGKVQGMKLVKGSGDRNLDRAAWSGITGSDPFPPLPAGFKGEYLALRLHFQYNPDKQNLEKSGAK